MSTISALVERLRAGQRVLSAWCGIQESSIAGLLAREAFDAVTLDMQHGMIDFAATVRAIPLIAAAGKPAIARIPVGEFGMASRLLDAGASAVIAPMINTVEDARRFASFIKFPPLGERSWGPHVALALSGLQPGDYLVEANRFSLALAMIETREALAIIDNILNEPGVDGIFLGPSDLSLTLSGAAEVNPTSAEVNKVLAHALTRAKNAGKFAAVYAHSGERAGELAKKGFDLVAVSSDTGFLRAGAQAALAAARA